MSTLLDYLNILDQDANARAAHQSNPQAAMQNFGLSEEEQQALLSGDKQKVADLIGIPADELPAIDITESTY